MSCNAVCTSNLIAIKIDRWRIQPPCINTFSTRDAKNRLYGDRIYLIAEREAKDAVSWLKAAGFPQYVQMYAGKLCTVVSNASQQDVILLTCRWGISYRLVENTGGE